MVGQGRLEAMNASPHHAKVRVSLKLADNLFVAGSTITGKMEMECKADLGLGIGIIMVELFAVEELTSRDHSATSTFLHTRRLFQGPGLPPSNAVQTNTYPGDPPLPTNYYTARRGTTSFLFRLPIPESSPSAINFGSGLAQVRYEVRATVGVVWKGENRLVFDKKMVDVVESFDEDFSRVEPEAVIVGENGRIWVQGKVVGGFMVAGQPGCVELQVKNHSSKKNTGLSISLTRELYLPSQHLSQKQPLQITDTLTSVSFRGPDYIIQAGAEGVANLVFDLPLTARGVKGGQRQGDEEARKIIESLFEVRCLVNVKLSMGIGSKDLVLSIPVTVLHPSAVPILPDPDPYVVPPQPYPAPMYDPMSAMAYPPLPMSPVPLMDRPLSPYSYASPPMSPPLLPYVDQGQVWFPPPISGSVPHALFHPPPPPPMSYQYYVSPPQSLSIPYAPPPRPSSAEPIPSQPFDGVSGGLPPAAVQQPLLPLLPDNQQTPEREEGKGERASRIALHLRMSSRNRSVSPPAHRYAVPLAPELHAQAVPYSPSSSIPVPDRTSFVQPNLSPSSSPQTQRRRPATPNLSVSPARSQGSVVSPRPMPSPKQSFSGNPFEQITHIEQLERIAALVDSENANMSISGVSPVTSIDNRDKTLPRVPNPTERQVVSLAIPARADGVFPSDAVRPDDTPPTPTLAAVTSLKVPRATGLGVGVGPSGLDALEAKLLAEVGTRKAEKNERPDVRSVLPIAIPRPMEGDPANESAISSLTLPGLDWDAKTLKLGPTNFEHDIDHEEQDDDRALTEGRRDHQRDLESKENKQVGSAGTRKSKDKDKHSGRRSGERAVTSKDEELHKLKKTVHGRVAAWLGTIDPEVPPRSGTPPPASPKAVADLTDLTREDAQGRVAAWLGTIQPEIEERSSPAPHTPEVVGIVESNPHELPRRDSSPKSRSPEDTRTRDDGNVSASPNPRSSGFVPISSLRPKKSQLPASIRPTNVNASDKTIPHLPINAPRPLDPEVRYDIRSARGGRGGKVAAVAAIWASATQLKDQAHSQSKPSITSRQAGAPSTSPASLTPILQPANSPKSPAVLKPTAKHVQSPAMPLKITQRSLSTKPDAKLPPNVDLNAKRARVTKSTSVPAMISSSLATPMLSSSASLAHPSPALADRNKVNVKFAPIASGDSQVISKVDTSKPPVARAELAFGRARLRELIKRYQGPTDA